MENLQLRLQLRSTVQDYLNNLMTQNHITATQMEDTLNYILVGLKDSVLAEYAIYAMEEAEKDKHQALEEIKNLNETEETSSEILATPVEEELEEE